MQPRDRTQSYLVSNKVARAALKTASTQIEFGFRDNNARTFTVTNNNPNAIRVTATSNQNPVFFGRQDDDYATTPSPSCFRTVN